MVEKNIYFPCIHIEHEKDSTFSIICSDFHYFDDYFGEKGGGGYTLERLAKKLVKEHKIEEIKYDSEAGMFCAYSDTSDNLLQLCNLLREITGDESEHLPSEQTKPLIPLNKAEKLLLKGFVKGLDIKAQKDFLKNVPMPTLSKNQSKYLNYIQNGTDEEKIKSAKKINSEARTHTRNWDNYLSHPNTISILLKAIDETENKKVYTELLDAVVFICNRHLPDLRTQAYFIKALKSKIARNRQVAIWGLENLYDYPFEEILPLINDKSSIVREALLSTINRKEFRFASWMFNPIQHKVNKRPKDFSVFYPLFADENPKSKFDILGAILKLEENELFPKLKDLFPQFKENIKNENRPHFKKRYEEVIERLEKIE